MNHFCKEVPIIVVGCKTDLRKDKLLVKKLRKNRLEPVTYHRVGNLARGAGVGVPGEETPGVTLLRPSLSAAPDIWHPRGVGQGRGCFRGSHGQELPGLEVSSCGMESE